MSNGPPASVGGPVHTVGMAVMCLENLDPLDMLMIEQISALTEYGKRIRAAGFPCKHVYRAWPCEESDICLAGERVEFCVYVDLEDAPHTACFSEDTVYVSEGW